MARYIKDFQTNSEPQTVHSVVNQYLQSEGYEYINYDGENVFKKGNGVWSNPTFFKFSYSGNMVRMETWMKYAFFPGVYVGELGVTGFVGGAVKGPWKKRINKLEGILSNFAMQTMNHTYTSTQNNNFSACDNETQLLNDKNIFEETCIMNEEKVETGAVNRPVFCNGCGNQLAEGALFCSVCGQKRTNSESAAFTQTQQASQNDFSQSNTFNYNTENPLPPSGYPVSRKEFINKYAQPSLKKNITSIAILCYVCAGITFVMSCLLNPLGIIDALVLAAFALGMHLAKSKVCAILILILSIVEVLLSLVSGSFPFWWLVAGVSAVNTFNKIEKQYREFLKR